MHPMMSWHCSWEQCWPTAAHMFLKGQMKLQWVLEYFSHLCKLLCIQSCLGLPQSDQSLYIHYSLQCEWKLMTEEVFAPLVLFPLLWLCQTHLQQLVCINHLVCLLAGQHLCAVLLLPVFFCDYSSQQLTSVNLNLMLWMLKKGHEGRLFVVLFVGA